MKRTLLVITGLIITACFSMYIFEIDLSDKDDHIGHQNDVAVNITDHPNDAATAAIAGRQYSVAAANMDHWELLDDTASPAQAGHTEEPDGWELIWADEFEKRSIDLEYWTEIDRKNNYNNELQCYLPENSFTQDGCLCLVAKKEKRRGKDYVSAMVETRDKLSVLYSRVEVRAKLSVGKGLFPAIWMLTADGAGEIDIMEMIGSEPNIIYGVNHYKKKGPQKTVGSVTCNTPEEFHVYAVEWDKDEIRWYIDGLLFHKTGKGVPSKDMYIILTLAVGGDWPGDPDEGTAFPCSMRVDYIRIYKRVERAKA